ncbi:MAG: WbqC family protein [Candidatus Hydrogenedentota bacterium]
MIVSIHQPHYFPYPGFFHKILQSDAFIFLDSVQYVKNEWINRNVLKGPNGKVFITIPVHYKFPQKINDVLIDNRTEWIKKHINTIKTCYGRAKYFSKYFDILKESLNINETNLSLFLIKHLLILFERLNIKIPYFTASDIGVYTFNPTLRIIELCKNVGGDMYLSGPAGKDYLEEDLFKKHNIELIYQEYSPVKYNQNFEKLGFIENLSVIDLLMNTDDTIINSYKDRSSRIR